MMAAAPPRERITLTVSTTPDGGYAVRGTCYASAGGTGTKKTWDLITRFEEIEQWSFRTNQRLGYSLPPPPPQDLCTVL